MTGIVELLATIVAALERAGIPHMVAGSVASTYHGRPRTTQDIDVVISPDPAALSSFVDSLDPERFYVGDAIGALARRDQFNIIETGTGWKVNLIIRSDRPFSHKEFERRQPVELGPVSTYVATPEDTVLAKLEWAAASGSDRQVDDIVGVLEVVGDDIDHAYLRHWAGELGVTDLLDQALERAAR